MADHFDSMLNLISPPGDTISDLLQERRIATAEFAAQIGESVTALKQLIAGKAELTLEVAQKLELSLGVKTAFWVKRESTYRERLLRRSLVESEKEKWLASLPLKEMFKFGWLQAHSAARNDLYQACLDFFGESDLSSWKNTYSDPLSVPMFRTSTAFDSNSTAVAAWLRQGEIEAKKIVCKPWQAKEFMTALQLVRPLTRAKDPSVFLPELQRVCAGAGVAVVIVRAPSGCRASGATQFLTSDKALLMLSFRYLSDDHFWFTFFHEAGHLLLHATEDLCLEGANDQNERIEAEANDFAARTLVPLEFESEMIELPVHAHSVIAFARRLGISPGIVVGQLQHRGIITRRQLNNLKRRYSWGDQES